MKNNRTNILKKNKMKYPLIILFSLTFFSISTQGFGQNTFPASGNVGIGTASPGFELEIKEGDLYLNHSTAGAIRSKGNFLDFKGQSDNAYAHRAYRFFPATGPAVTKSSITLFQGSTDETFTEKIKISSTDPTYFNGGNVGIGTSSPSRELDVAGAIKTYYLYPGMGSGDPYRYLRFGDENNFWAGFMWNNTSNAYGNGNDFSIFTYDNRDFTLRSGTGNIILHPDNQGNVGIGTTIPSTELEVNGTIKIPLATSVDNNSPGIVSIINDDFLYDDQHLNHYGMGFHRYDDGNGSNGINAYISGYYGVDLFSGGQSRIRINLNGNVGIGTPNPNEKLTVIGGAISVEASGDGTKAYKFGNNYGQVYYDASTVGESNRGIYFQEQLSDLRGFHFLNSSGIELFKIQGNGNIGIGTTSPDAKLAVKGDIHAQEVRIDLNGAIAPDFVFEPDYKLRTLAETEAYIKENKHLPEIPSAAEMEENGFELKAMNLKLLQKIEELTLYTIEQQKLIEKTLKQNEKLIKRIENLENK